MQRRRAVLAAFVVATVVVGCGSSNSGSDSVNKCVPGRTIGCPCSGGSEVSGTQTCRNDGTFGPCECMSKSQVVGYVDRIPAADVELLHTFGGTVTVSSTVANNAHLPKHLVDGDLSTAWNSLTGELVGSWVRIDLPARTQLKALKLTAGFTGRGPKGEDYFVMNARIRRIRVLADGKAIGDFDVDVEHRELQSIPLDTEASSLRIEVLAVAPGAKKNWLETAISELELWGTLPNGVAPRRTSPDVRVDSAKRPCPETASLAKFVRVASAVAKKKGKLTVYGCRAGRFPDWGWYVAASYFTSPPPPPLPSKDNPQGLPEDMNEAFGHYFIIRSVLDSNGSSVAILETEDDPNHAFYWDSLDVKDINGDGIDESVEELSGGGGVRRRDRHVYRVVGKEIKKESSKTIGWYEPDGVYTPEP